MFWILAIFTILMIVLIVALTHMYRRDYWRRLSGNLQACSLTKRQSVEITRSGARNDRIGVISYSLYGNYAKYLPQLLKNLERIAIEMPHWQARVYVSETVPPAAREEMTSRGSEIIVMSSNEGHEAALWRFLPGKDNLTFVSLDADDEFDRKLEINEWIESNKPFGLFNRNKFLLPMTAGTWGARAGTLTDISTLLDQYCEHWFGFDEAFLYQEVWPRVQQQGYWESSGIPWTVLFFLLILVIFLLAGWLLFSSLN